MTRRRKSSKPRKVCRPLTLGASGATLRGRVAAYLKSEEACADDLKYYRTAPSLAEAIRRAAMAEQAHGLKHPHQGGTPPASLREATRRLQAVQKKISRLKDFDALHDFIEAEIDDIYKVGQLVIYDTAHRIGAYLRLKPKSIYMHAGTREGAEALLGRRVSAKRLALGDFPMAMRALTPEQAEDFLCRCKDELGQFAPKRTSDEEE